MHIRLSRSSISRGAEIKEMTASMDWSSQRVIVTGGAGFVGHHLVEHLEHLGAREIMVPRSRDYDLRRADQVERLFADYSLTTMVIHLGEVSVARVNQGQHASPAHRRRPEHQALVEAKNVENTAQTSRQCRSAACLCAGIFSALTEPPLA